MIDLKYPEATGLLQARCVQAAIEIESVLEVFLIDAWAKAELLKTAKKLRDADRTAEALVETYENGAERT